MPASTRVLEVTGRIALVAGIVVGGGAAGCATGSTGSTGAGMGYNSSPPAGFVVKGPPEIAATSTLPADSGRAPVALRAAAVLREHDRPLVVVDSSTGVLISDWQYFEPAIPRPGALACDRGMGLRVSVRPLPKARAVVLTEQVALARATDAREAMAYARTIFKALRDEIAAAPDPDVEPVAQTQGFVTVSRVLGQGGFHVCGGVGG